MRVEHRLGFGLENGDTTRRWILECEMPVFNGTNRCILCDNAAARHVIGASLGLWICTVCCSGLVSCTLCQVAGSKLLFKEPENGNSLGIHSMVHVCFVPFPRGWHRLELACVIRVYTADRAGSN